MRIEDMSAAELREFIASAVGLSERYPRLLDSIVDAVETAHARLVALGEQHGGGTVGDYDEFMAEYASGAARLCDYATGYGLPHVERCGEPAVGKWHDEDDEWFCAKHIHGGE